MNRKDMNDIRRNSHYKCGKIGSAMIQAFRDCFKYIEIIATGRREPLPKNAELLGTIATRDNNEAVNPSDLVILSVKPTLFARCN
ncbi:MAG: NAD(P)-binding domain-containing protein [Desulfurococcaceae archaeon]